MEKLPDNIKQEILGLGTLDAAKLREQYGELLRDISECKSSCILRQVIAFRLQERYYGISITKEVEDWMSENSEGATLGFKDKSTNLNARIIRIWKGAKYEVCVHENGRYEYDGKFYKSLSAIAKVITGTQWNGKIFFGVK